MSIIKLTVGIDDKQYLSSIKRMRRKTITADTKVNGYYVRDVMRGFFGEKGEGRKLLLDMGLNPNVVPFSVAVFLRDHKISWKDHLGNKASIRFRFKPDFMECTGNYLGKTKSYRLIREWGANDDPEMVAQLESEAIGELCMKCINDKLDLMT